MADNRGTAFGKARMTQRDGTETGTQQRLPPEALYLPFEVGPHRMLMGLVARIWTS